METKETAVHPTAVVMPGAELGQGVEVGPYVVIEPGVVVGDRCRIHPFARLCGRTQIGVETTVGSGSVLGSDPQDKAYTGESTSVEIGSQCILHEYVTIHRATEEGVTRVGNGVVMMTGSHVGHNATVERGRWSRTRRRARLSFDGLGRAPIRTNRTTYPDRRRLHGDARRPTFFDRRRKLPGRVARAQRGWTQACGIF